ncbi:MAG: MFS transporter [Desulfitobacteriaceae bacterium]
MMVETKSLGERTLRKVTYRILPFIFVLYIVAFLDRVNLGYAALTMNKALALSSSVFGLISGIFFLGYFIFEVPSNILMHRIGARVWIARILVSWGIVVIITAWVSNATHLYILRFLLGVAEAGFFPGIILYMTYWFPAKNQARAFALFMTALAVSNIIGAPVSTWILGFNALGLAGWRWLFILEGAPAVIMGIVTIFYLTDRPEKANWLDKEEKEWLLAELKKEKGDKLQTKHLSTRQVMLNPRVWHLSFIYLSLVVGLYGIGFWLPQIIKAFSKVLTNQQVGFITMIPYIVGGIAMIIVARHSDSTGERRYHTAIPPLIGAFALIGSGLTSNPYVSIIMLSIATAGIYSFFGSFWSLPPMFLTGEAAAVGIAVINSVGNLGGFIGPYVLGALKDVTGSMTTGLYFLSACLVATTLLVLAIRKEHTVTDYKKGKKSA